MGGDTGGYDKAKNEIQQGMGQQTQIEQGAEQVYNPFLAAGQGAIGNYQNALAQGANPAQYYSQLMSGYQQSPYLDAQIAAGQKAANMANSASGMLGSGAAMREAASQAQDLRGQDVQNYMNSVMAMHNQYLQGQQGLMGMGLGAAQGISGDKMGLGNWIGQGYTGMANADIAQAQAQQASNGQMLQLAGTIAGGLGGFMIGGPVGAAAGASLGSNL